MKSIAIVSTVSFLVIFGGLYFYVSALGPGPAADSPGSPLPADDIDAAELAFAALELERHQIQTERSRLQRLRDDVSVRDASLQEQRKLLIETIDNLRSEQVAFNGARAASAMKLAKMFDAMKPNSSAPILSSLDEDTALDILALRMKERSAAKLLASLAPAKAAALSARLSLRGERS